MDYNTIILIALLIIILWRPLTTWLFEENYATKNEKVNTIYNWFKSRDMPNYEEYKNTVEGSDVVEYSDVKRLKYGGNLSTAAVASVIS